MKITDSKILLRSILTFTLIYTGSVLNSLFRFLEKEQLLWTSARWTTGILFMFAILAVLIVLLVLTWTRLGKRLLIWLNDGLPVFRSLGKTNLLFFAITACGLPFLVLGPAGKFFTARLDRLWALWVLGLLGGLFLTSYNRRKFWPDNLALSLAWLAAIHLVASFIPSVSTNPFSLGWSEGSRYYYASLLFSEKLYGVRLSPSVWHPSRYILQSIPFIFTGLPLWVHRLWQVMLWIGMTSLGAFSLMQRMPLKGKTTWKFLYFAWALLFLFQGPVYYHLFVTVVLILLGFDSQKFWRSMAIILLASLWAGISRINWAPVPAILGGVLYLMEKPLAEGETIWRYLAKPVAWGIAGIAAAMSAQSTYALLSGNDLSQFGSSFTSDLLWHRLLPNPTYNYGILIGIGLASLPIILIILLKGRGLWRAYHPIRLLGLGGALAALAGMGLIVSTKIGGGGDLHNLDAFLVTLLTAGSYFHFDRFAPDLPLPKPATRTPLPALGLALLVPIWFALQLGSPLQPADAVQTQKVLENLRAITSETAANGGEILFISQRQLLIFGYIRDVKLVPEYENITLMEMAMSGNQAYLERFYRDIRNKRFALIISHRNPTFSKGSAEPLGEENDAWVKRISLPLFESYKVQRLFKIVGVEILVPIP